MKEVKECKIHGLVEHSVYHYKTKKRFRCLTCYKKIINDFRIKRKQTYIDYKGGGCLVCGYNNSAEALDFHHLDPNKKDFTISDSYRDLEKMKLELDKCVLVCANHHREIHAGILNINCYLP